MNYGGIPITTSKHVPEGTAVLVNVFGVAKIAMHPEDYRRAFQPVPLWCRYTLGSAEARRDRRLQRRQSFG